MGKVGLSLSCLRLDGTKKEKEGGRGRGIKSLMFKVGWDKEGEGRGRGSGIKSLMFKVGWDEEGEGRWEGEGD